MRLVRLDSEVDFEGWRRAARALATAEVLPEDVEWAVGAGGSLLGTEAPEVRGAAHGDFTVRRAFLALARTALLHRDPARYALAYRLLWRLRREPGLLAVASDRDVSALRAMADNVRREIHKTHAFVRFREVTDPQGSAYIAWFEPEHHTLEAAAPFFVRRFATMRWSILTPRVSAHWDLNALTFTSGSPRAAAPTGDALEALWRTYYASIFNPARLKTQAMRSEMPRKYWANLPEAELIGTLVAQAPQAAARMIAAPATVPRRRAPPPAPAAEPAGGDSLDSLRAEALGCTRCPLYRSATQTVFGEGPAPADLMFVGEQPGDREDLEGRPFVGPAGAVFDRALKDAGFARSAAYVTNAVKHFKFEPRGRRRLHKTPGQQEIEACRHWLEREIARVAPRLIVALGASAASSVLGRATPVQRVRGRLIDVSPQTRVLVTVHPSYLLRVPEQNKAAEYARFVADLATARTALAQPRG